VVDLDKRSAPLDRHVGLAPLVLHGELAAELRSIARDDARAGRDERRLLNRPHANLQAVHPVALAIAGDDLGAPTVLRLLERYPLALLRETSREELVELARRGRHGWPHRFPDRGAALAEAHFVARDYLARAKADTIRLTATQLLATVGQRRAGCPALPGNQINEASHPSRATNL